MGNSTSSDISSAPADGQIQNKPARRSSVNQKVLIGPGFWTKNDKANPQTIPEEGEKPTKLISSASPSAFVTSRTPRDTSPLDSNPPKRKQSRAKRKNSISSTSSIPSQTPSPTSQGRDKSPRHSSDDDVDGERDLNEIVMQEDYYNDDLHDDEKLSTSLGDLMLDGVNDANGVAPVFLVPGGGDESTTTITDDGLKLMPIEIKWVGTGIEKEIYIIGSFSNWKLDPRLSLTRKPREEHSGVEYSLIVKLPQGVHKLVYLIDRERVISDNVATATDHHGNFVNWFEVVENNSAKHPNYLDSKSRSSSSYINHHEMSFTLPADNSPKDLDFHAIRPESDSHAISPHPHGCVTPLGVSTVQLTPNLPDVDIFKSALSVPAVQYTKNIPAIYMDPEAYPRLLSSAEVNDTETDGDKSTEDDPSSDEETAKSAKRKEKNKKMEPPHLPPHLSHVLLHKTLLHPDKIKKHVDVNTNSQDHHFHYKAKTAADEGAKASPMSRTSSGNTRAALVSQHNMLRSHPGSPSRTSSPKEATNLGKYAQYQKHERTEVPSHVILNHLATTSIKSDVLAVACINRYYGKFVNSIMYSPISERMFAQSQET